MLKKIFSVPLTVILLFNMTISSLNVSSLEVDEATKVNFEETNVIAKNELGLDYIVPVTKGSKTTYYDQNHNVVDITKNNSTKTLNKSLLPDSFDLRDENRVTSVKNQGKEGFCWSFASIASIESNILSNPELRAKLGENPHETLDLSEVGIPWYICTSVDDELSPFYGDYYRDDSKGSEGGNTGMTVAGLSSGFGVYPEELFPYSSWGSTYSEALRFYSDYRLKEFVILENDVDVIKTRVMDYGAVCTSYNSFNTNYYYNDDNMQSYYDNGESLDPSHINQTHVVVIVGWDDNYSKDNFNPQMRPENNGAWLCKNSWGEGKVSQAEGYEGYFWMSYETDVYEFSQFVVQSADEFDNIYQHQFSSTYSTEVTSAANIFTAQRDEVIKQICFSNTISSDATIEIYKLNKNYSSPEDGVLLTSFDGSTDCSGTHTFDVPDKAEFKEGEVFSVVIKGDEPVDINVKYFEETKANKSFFKSDDQWLDVTNYDIGYFIIKAYTSNKDDVVYKDKLESTINKAEYSRDNLKMSTNFMSNLEKIISESKYVFNDSFATQNKVDNMVCLLENEIDKCKYSYFEINTTDDFTLLNKEAAKGRYSDALIVLNSDLDFSNNTTILPLFFGKTFRGEFDGNGHTISNLNVSYYSTCGLFSEIENAVIKNVELKNCYFTSAMNTGTIAGKATNSTVSDCTIIDTKVVNDKDYAGGITGYAEYAVINNCSVKNSKIVSRNNTACGLVGSGFGSKLHSCNITNTEIIGYFTAILFADQDVYDCIYDNAVLKSFDYVSADFNRNVHNGNFPYENYSFIVFKDDKFIIQPYIGEISNVTSDEATVTQVGEFYELELNEDNSDAYAYIEYEPLNTNGFSFSFDIATDCITLSGYYNYDDETVTELVFPSYIGKLPVTDLNYFFSIESIATIKSIVLPENLGTIQASPFNNCTELEKITIPASITTVDADVFRGCSKLTDVYYGGTKEQWNKINFGDGNDYLTNANIHFASTPPTDPTKPKYDIGDVNKDGYISIDDATLVQEHIAKILAFDAEQLILADANMDNYINIDDTTYIQMKVAHII